MSSSTTIPEGTLISGKYRVIRELGRGGMAAVYEAVNLDIGKRVALKLLAGHLTKSQTVVERFLREARAVARIKSPHICDVYDASKLDDGTPYLVLELLEGESLYEAMVRDRQMSSGLTVAILLQVCRGLVKAHDAQIVHRDLKPENIFLTVDDEGQLLVKVLDFGLAKFYETNASPDTPARLTREGAVFGTPVYMSPEQVRGQARADHRSDLWALACIAYECLTGTTVWSTEQGVAMTFAQIATAPLPDPEHYRPDLPKSFKAWYERALHRDIEQRYQTVAEFANSLAEAFAMDGEAGDAPHSLVAKLRAGPPPSQPVSSQQVANQPAASSVPTPAPVSEPLPMRPSAASEPMSLKRPVLPSLPTKIPRFRVNPKRVALAAATAAVLLIIIGLSRSSENAPAPAPLKRVASLTDRFVSSDGEQTPGIRIVSRHPWLPRLREAQMRISRGEPKRAIAILKRIGERHRHPMIDNLIGQAKIAQRAIDNQSRCQIVGLARPRRYDLLNKNVPSIRSTSSPTIVPGINGPTMAWSDNRQGKRRAFAVPLDDALRNRNIPLDITPEGSSVYDTVLLPVAKRYLATYSDSGGANGGVFLRWLRSNAVIDTPPIKVVTRQRQRLRTHSARLGDGFVVGWAEARDPDAVDLLLRRYDADLSPKTKPVRVTDYSKKGHQVPRITTVRLATDEKWIHATYVVATGSKQELRYQTIAANVTGSGLEATDRRRSRTLSEEIELSDAKFKAGAPSIGCTNEGCFIAWHRARQGGASVAFIDAKSRQLQWHKLFAPRGRYPSVGVSPKGKARLLWVQGGRLTTAKLDRSGVGPESRVGRTSYGQVSSIIAPGSKTGEWLIGWLDREGARAEPYASLIRCR